jgi:hypothetical protein
MVCQPFNTTLITLLSTDDLSGGIMMLRPLTEEAAHPEEEKMRLMQTVTMNKNDFIRFPFEDRGNSGVGARTRKLS